MKKVMLVIALFVQVSVGSAATKPEPIPAQVKTDNVQMYLQPGTSAEVLQTLKTTDKVVILRKYNTIWTLVTVNGQPGYVLGIELANATPEKVAFYSKGK